MIIEKILVTGACGQLGNVLTSKLQEKWGTNNVIASDLRSLTDFNGVFETLDATDYDAMEALVIKHDITQIYHLAAILSAKGEKEPLDTWNVNMKTLLNVLEVSRLHKVKKVFYPSSIAVFGDKIERVNTSQSPNLTPTTVYGMSKVAGENWGNYYHHKYGLDIRSIRYPGIIGHQSLPGGGTTDYAVYIYHKAIKNEQFECFLKPKTFLPMIYIDDAVRATIEIMDAPKEKITIRTSYNISGMSISPEQMVTSIKNTYPDFKAVYNPDYRQNIADSWPMSIDDSAARTDWNWMPKYLLEDMTKEMIEKLKHKHSLKEIQL
ncbi:NAD-dependent epimerase/dehydratase family protein [Maribacter polysaccharolyticus]|uniref:NAD-dependent epimerase/dehydratase family protein n=1 Tax=Maribacter polysaccharolyticus TaxID=3020831 RepID=UPI00237F8910|nr:NAD-dependent epimerase/dehydratase family protein [Maribacter polysaccharolyticus]MDE3741020.1 NAD-dependent epimerase/dehydratase family protein [Maribacter polysaccharolyticus]